MYKILHILTGEFVWTIYGSGLIYLGEPVFNKYSVCCYATRNQAEKLIKNACSDMYLTYIPQEITHQDIYSFQRKKLITDCVESEFEIVEVPDV